MKPSLSGWEGRLHSGAQDILGRGLTDPERGRFGKYLILLTKWQRVQRLVGSVEPHWVVDHLFLDSLLFLRVLGSSATDVLDIGSGAGFPGVPLMIVTPQMRLTMIEARKRRASFLRAVVRGLELTDAVVIDQRAEKVAHELEGRFTAVVARCAEGAHVIMPLIERLLAPSGLGVVSGPPDPKTLRIGEWVETAGLRGGIRRFAVYRKN